MNKNPKKITQTDLLKYEIAEHLGLGDKLREVGWGGITASEAGRIGGMMNRFKDRKG